MRIDAYMQVNQLYQSSKPKSASKSKSAASANDSLEIPASQRIIRWQRKRLPKYLMFGKIR